MYIPLTLLSSPFTPIDFLTSRVPGNCRGAQPTSQDTIGHTWFHTHLDLTGSVIIPELALVVGFKPTKISMVRLDLTLAAIITINYSSGGALDPQALLVRGCLKSSTRLVAEVGFQPTTSRLLARYSISRMEDDGLSVPVLILSELSRNGFTDRINAC